MELCEYQVKIQGEDGIGLIVYHRAPIDSEEEILDYMWQVYSDFQPDKSFYSVINLSTDICYSIPKEIKNRMHFHLAVRAIEYVAEFN